MLSNKRLSWLQAEQRNAKRRANNADDAYVIMRRMRDDNSDNSAWDVLYEEAARYLRECENRLEAVNDAVYFAECRERNEAERARRDA